MKNESEPSAPAQRAPVRAAIFDLDGTLVDSEENYYLADKALLEQYGIPFTREDKRRYIGGGNLEMMIDLRRRFGLRESPQELAERKNRLYLHLALAGTRVYAEMRRFLDMLRAAGLPVAVASGSSPEVLDRILAAVGLAGDLDAVVSAEHVPRGKPAPDVFLEAARRLGAPPRECLVIEDSQPGVVAATRASMRCIAVPYLVDETLADSFLLADLLFRGGMEEFRAAEAYRWVEPLLAP